MAERHSLSKVLFPNPAGAEINESGQRSPAIMRSTRRLRLTRILGAGGGKNFVDKIID
jgi:hypothetical protein